MVPAEHLEAHFFSVLLFFLRRSDRSIGAQESRLFVEDHLSCWQAARSVFYPGWFSFRLLATRAPTLVATVRLGLSWLPAPRVSQGFPVG
jgi:hypothetical protein